jgi:hypothetical protein
LSRATLNAVQKIAETENLPVQGSTTAGKKDLGRVSVAVILVDLPLPEPVEPHWRAGCVGIFRRKRAGRRKRQINIYPN